MPTPKKTPAAKPQKQPADKASAKPAARREAKPAAKPPAKAAAKPSAKPAVKPLAKPAAKPSAKPAVKPAAKPSAKPAAKPSAKPSVKPAAKPSAKPAAKPSAKPAPQPAAKASARPAGKAPAKNPVQAKPAAAALAGRTGGETQGQATVFFPRRPMPAVAPGAAISGRDMLRGAPPEKEQPPEPPMGKKELAAVQAALEERRDGLLAAMKRDLASQRDRLADASSDEVDKATDAYDEDLRFEMATANDEELDGIAVALRKIGAGTYGQCEACGRPIARQRLKALPFAVTCVSCRGQEGLPRRGDDPGSLFSLLSDDETEPDDGEA